MKRISANPVFVLAFIVLAVSAVWMYSLKRQDSGAISLRGNADTRANITSSPVKPETGYILVKTKNESLLNKLKNDEGMAEDTQNMERLNKIGIKRFKVNSANSTTEEAAARIHAKLKSDDATAFAEADALIPAALLPNDTYYSNEWYLPKIGTTTAWDTTTGSSEVIVAVLDTGCDPTHPDLAAKYVSGWNTYNNTSNFADTYGHGTMVAGQVAAVSNNGEGVASVSWKSRIMPIRIADDSGYATESAMASALVWAADHGARIANLSYNVTHVNAVDTAAAYFRSKGGLLTVAAGNNAWFDTVSDDPYMITVSATDQNNVIAPWSNTGNSLDMAAPGVSIPSTFVGGGYGVGSGTSASAPIVAGVASLIWSVNPSLTNDQVEGILKQSATDVGTKGWDSTYGWGVLNAAGAISLAQASLSGTPSPSPSISPSPSPSPNPVSVLSFTLGPSVSSKTSTSATLSGSTSMATTWKVMYGLKSTSLTSSVTDSASLTTHTLTITGLGAGRTYFYKVVATAADGSVISSAISSFKTPRR